MMIDQPAIVCVNLLGKGIGCSGLRMFAASSESRSKEALMSTVQYCSTHTAGAEATASELAPRA